MKTHARLAAAAVATLLVVTGCSTKAASTQTSSSAGGVKTGPGVTDTSITLGSLLDLSGSFAAAGKGILQTENLYFDQVNSSGGVCGRQLILQNQDTGYDVQRAVGEYSSLAPQVAAMAQVLGSPIVAGLTDSIRSDGIVSVAANLDSAGLSNPYILIATSTYDTEAINSLSYLVKQGILKKGDSVGHIYFQSAFGANALRGSTWGAQQLGLKLVAQPVQPTDQDMTAQITAFKNAGVKAILMSTGPVQHASAAAVSASRGYNVPLVITEGNFAPSSLKTAGGPALIKNGIFLGSYRPYGDKTNATAQKVAALSDAKYPDGTKDWSVTYTWGTAKIMVDILKKACDAKDLSRAGINAAFRSTTASDTGGLFPPGDFSHPGSPASREDAIFRADPTVVGGLVQITPFEASDIVGNYVAPAQK